MRTRWFLLGLGALVVLALAAFPWWWPLVNRPLGDEALPGLSLLPPAEQALIEAMAAENPEMAQAMIDAGLADPTVVPEAGQMMPEMPGAAIYAVGDFAEIDALHWARGTVTVYQEADGSWMLRFEDFEARNGPQLHVFLSAHPGPRSAEEVRQAPLGGLDLGALQGNVGNQSYALPAELSMSEVRSVVIYSVRFQVVFSSAELFRQ